LNIVDPVFHQGRMNPGGLAICVPGARIESVNYATLVHVINNIARRVLWEGVRREDVVALSLKDPILHFAFALALARVGIASVTAPASGLPTTLHLNAAIADGGAVIGHTGRVLAADFSWMDGDGKPLSDPGLRRIQGDETCRIEFGKDQARAVALSHDLLVRRGDALQHSGSFGSSQRLYCDLASDAARVFELMLHTLSRGGTIFLGDDPEVTGQAFGLYKVQAMFARSDRLAAYLKFFEARRDIQQRFDCVTVADPIGKEVADRVRMRMAPLLYASYSTAEAGTIALAPMHRIEHVPGAVGWELPGVRIEIADRSGAPAAAGKEGRVRVRSPYAAPDYPGEAAARQGGDGYLETGDVGFLTEDRLLVILGRDEPRLSAESGHVRRGI
jgi:acyl-coenzyme A synthetase/AMP-(fatty) acid ligase